MKNLLTAASFIFIVQLSFGQKLVRYEEEIKIEFKDSIGNVVIPVGKIYGFKHNKIHYAPKIVIDQKIRNYEN